MPRARILTVVAVTVLALAGCSSAPMPTPTPTPSPTPLGDGVLRIGTLFPTSGTTSFLGASQIAGVDAAVRAINEAGGVNGEPVEVIHRDSADAGSEKAEKSLAELIDKGVDVIIGPSSSVLAQRLLEPAAEAGIPMISPAATYPQLTDLDEADLFFRTIPVYDHQGVVLAGLLADREVETAALVYSDDALGRALRATFEAAAADVGLQVVSVPATSSASADAAAVKKADPEAVVLATPNNGSGTRALITQLVSAGYGGDKLWLTSQNLADYSQSLPGGRLKDANGVLEGDSSSGSFQTVLKREKSGLSRFDYAPEAYDATILAALAATIAGDDDPSAIAASLRDASVGGIKCTSYAECLEVLATQPDIDYDGVSGSVNLDAAGDPERGSYGVYEYGSNNKPSRKSTVVG